jgi:GST-like protein
VSIQQEPDPIAKERASREVERVLSVLDQLLARHEHVAGSVYSIADIAHFGWLWRHQAIGATFDGLPNVARWFTQVSARPAVQSAIVAIAA